MRRGQRRGPSNFLVGAVVLTIAAIGTFLGFNKEIPFRSHYTVSAVFKTANNIKPNSFVRIAGVNVGKVTAIKRLGDGGESAVVEMRIQDKGLPIHTDATLQIRPRIFLEGNFFVDVNPGSPSAEVVEDGDMIPINQTKSPVQLDQILTTLQTDTRKDLKTLLKELSTGLSGSGAAGYNRSIPYWEPAYRDGAIVAEAQLGLKPRDLSDYVKHSGKVAEALDRDRVALKDLITTFNVTAAAFAREDQSLQRAIAELPRTLRAGQPALAALNDAFPAVRRMVADLRPATRSSGPALDASLPFVKQVRKLVGKAELRGLVRDLRPVVPSLTKLNTTNVPLQEQVRAASSCQNEVILPWSKDKIADETFPATGRVFEESTKTLGGLAGESRSGDANGQWFRVLLGYGNFASTFGTDEIFLSNAPLIGTNPPKPAARSQLRPDVACETQQTPDLRTVAGAAPKSHRISVSPDKKDDYDRLFKREVGDLNEQINKTSLKGKWRATTKPLSPALFEKLKQQAAIAKRRNLPR